jgi:ABC-2 type transport system permease protein
VLPELRTALDPAALDAMTGPRAAAPGAPPTAGPMGANPGGNPGFTPGHAPPVLTIIERPAGADVRQEKAWLIQPPKEEPRHLALAVIGSGAVNREPGKRDYASYDLYVSRGLDDATETVIQDGLQRALIASRFKAIGLDQSAVQATMRVARPSAVIVAAAGEQVARRGLNRALPFVCGILLFIGVITGGQLLMTSTVEEKSSRVVEVLLAAVSPRELMGGKLLAQLGVGLLILAMYVGLGLFALAQFSLLRLLDPMLVVYLVAFYAITYLVFGSLLLSIGAAVNQIQDAQSLMGPVMMLLVIPYVLTQFIGIAPNAPFSVALSFIPPANTFAMLARLASDTPPPLWQVCLTFLIGIAAAAGAVWFAAKIFKIGLLMHGKPPNLATLVRWARMA